MRILVERLWPRGLSKADAAIDRWMKDIAPTSELRTWFGHRAERWPEFRKRYRAELKRNVAPVEELRGLCGKHRVSFIFAARDVERNGRGRAPRLHHRRVAAKRRRVTLPAHVTFG